MIAVPFSEVDSPKFQQAIESASILSILGCACIFGIYYLRKDRQTMMGLLVIYATISNLLIALGLVWGRFPSLVNDLSRQFSPGQMLASSVLCVFQGWLINTAGLASAIWNGALSTRLLLAITRPTHINEGNSLFLYHVICWGIPCSLSTVAFALAAGGVGISPAYEFTSHDYCWLNDAFVRFALFYIWLWVMFGYTIIVYAIVYYNISIYFKRIRGITYLPDSLSPKSPPLAGSPTSPDRVFNQKAAQTTISMKIILKTAIYAAIFVFSWVPMTYHCYLEYSGQDHGSIVMHTVMTVAVASQGMLFALNYCFWVCFDDWKSGIGLIGRARVGLAK